MDDPIKKQFIGAVIDVGKDIAEDVVRPTSKSVGDNLGLLVEGVMGWLGYWGEKQKIKREVYLQDYKAKITQQVLGIPQERLIEPPISVVGPAVEASKYFIEEENCRDMFAKLIASACDSSLSNAVHPSFTEIIKQLSPMDARFIAIFQHGETYPAVSWRVMHSDKKVTPYNHLSFDLKSHNNEFDYQEQLNLTKTVDNLMRFGLLRMNTGVLELNYDYNQFKSHWFYEVVKQTCSEDSEITMTKYRLELTEFGKDFVKCCISD